MIAKNSQKKIILGHIYSFKKDQGDIDFNGLNAQEPKE
jgi:hypothetical protein